MNMYNVNEIPKFKLAEVNADIILAEAKVKALYSLKDFYSTAFGTKGVNTPVTETATSSPAVSTKATKGSAPKKAAPAVEDTEWDETDTDTDTETTEVELTEITDDEIRKAFSAFAKRNTTEKAKKILASYGVSNSISLSQEQRHEVMKRIG